MMTSSTKNKQVPKLRFSGFAGEWEEKIFGDVFERVNRKKRENNENVLTISAQKGLINQKKYFNKSVSAKDVTGYFLLKRGDFAYNRSYSNGYPMGAIKRLTKYDNGVVSTLYICFDIKKDDSGKYFEQYFEAGHHNRELYKIAQEGARVHGLLNLSVSEFFGDIKINVPIKEEQQKIASFLGLADEWIENLKAQKESLEKYKKGMMQKIFSQEIRFKDDNGNDFEEWEEKRIGDIGEIKTSSVDKKTNANEEKVFLLNYMDVYRRDHIFSSDTFQEITAKSGQITSCNLKLGDVLFTPSSETSSDIGHSAVVMGDLSGVLFSYHLMRFRPKKNILNPLFSGYAFKNFSFYKKLWRLAQGATRFTLSLEAMNGVDVIIPKSLKEQQKISEFLKSLDDLIEAKQQQIAQTENWKRGLMQGLFI